MSSDKAPLTSKVDAMVLRGGGVAELSELKGVYTAICYGPDGKEKWRAEATNTVVTVGKNLALDTILSGSAYTVTGPYMGLISADGYSTIVAGDTMSSHAGWNEASTSSFTPTYNGSLRYTSAFASASGGSITLSAANVFSITGTGTVKGAFQVYGTGATNTAGDTGGTLLSAGLFTGGDKPLGNGDTLNVSYQLSM